jgi:hypothetical protein
MPYMQIVVRMDRQRNPADGDGGNGDNGNGNGEPPRRGRFVVQRRLGYSPSYYPYQQYSGYNACRTVCADQGVAPDKCATVCRAACPQAPQYPYYRYYPSWSRRWVDITQPVSLG